MSKHTVKGFVHYRKNWDDTAEYSIFPFNMSGADRSLIGEQTFEVEVPDNFNPVPQMVAALEEQKTQLRLKCARELSMLDKQISQLTCLTNEAAA